MLTFGIGRYLRAAMLSIPVSIKFLDRAKKYSS